jgi:hypothetical protein
VKCQLSEVVCEHCEHYGDCQIYNERYVILKQMGSLEKKLEDTLTIVHNILGRERAKA